MKNYWKIIRERRPEALGFRLTVFIMGVTIVLFLIIMAVVVYVARSATSQEALSDTTSQVDDALELIDANLKGIEKTVKNASVMASRYTSEPEDCYQLCENVLLSDSDIYAVTIMFSPNYYRRSHSEVYVSSDHHLYCPTVSRDQNSDEFSRDNLTPVSDNDFNYVVEDSSWINTTKIKDGYWCEPYFDNYSTKQLLITYSYPIRDKNGCIYAVICADVHLQWMSQRMNDVKPTPDADLDVMTRSGHYLVHHISDFVFPRNGILGANAIESAKATRVPEVLRIIREIMSGERGFDTIKSSVTFNYCNKQDTIKPSYVYYAPIKRVGWYVSCMIPFDDINAKTNNLTIRLLLLSLLGLLIMSAALFYMVRMMVSPYKKFAAVDADIKTAAKIQMAMIPDVFPSKQQLVGNDLSATIIPAKSVGGDLYDYLISNNKLYFIIGDVSGKGVPASLFMAQARTLFRVATERYEHPDDIVSYINEHLSERNDMSMFVTVFVGILELSSGKLLFCNGGHNAPVIVSNGKSEFMKVKTNIPLGVMSGMTYEEEEFQMQCGDVIFVYTDGVTEAEDVQFHLYGDDRLLSLLSTVGDSTAHEICQNVIVDVKKHAVDTEQSDDITILCIKYQN